jgi:hypothetical protein
LVLDLSAALSLAVGLQIGLKRSSVGNIIMPRIVNPADRGAMSKLRGRLEEFKTTFESGAPPYNATLEVVATMHRATAELKASGIENTALKVGDQAPDFTLFNEDHVQSGPCGSGRQRIFFGKDRWSSASSEDTSDLTA